MFFICLFVFLLHSSRWLWQNCQLFVNPNLRQFFVTVKGPTSERQDSGLKHKDPKLNEPLHSQTFRKLVQRIENLRKEQFGYLSDQYAIQFKNENI